MATNEQIGVEAQFIIDQFLRQQQRYNAAIESADKTTAQFAVSTAQNFNAVEQSEKQLADTLNITQQQASSILKQAGSDVEDFSVTSSASFTDAAAQVAAWGVAVQQAYEVAREASQARGQREALRSLAASYGVNAGEIVQELQRISDGTLDAQQAVEIANSALLAGGAEFSSQIPQLFEIARAAAVASGQDIGFVLETLVKGIAKGSPLLIDNAEIYLSIGDAVEQYAESVGESVDELTRQERTVATLNAVTSEGAQIVERVGETALDATQSYDAFEASLRNVKGALGAALTAGQGFTIFGREFSSVIDLATQGLDALAKTIAIAAGGFTTLGSIISNLGVDDIPELISGTKTFDSILDEAAVAGQAAFQNVAESLGVFSNATDEAVQVTQELNDEIEESTEVTDEQAEAAQRYADTIENEQIRALEQLVDAEIRTSRAAEDEAIQRARDAEDAARASAQKRTEIEQSYQATIRNIDAQAAENRRRAEQQRNNRLLQIDRQYQETKRAINDRFAKSFQSAVRSRDALALVEAFRTRKKELGEAKRQRDQQRSDAQSDYTQQIAEQNRALETQRQNAVAARQKQLNDLKTAQQREIAEQRIADERKRQDQQRAAQRKEQDMARQFESARVRAQGEYQSDEALYRNHLERMLSLTNAYVPRIYRSSGGAGVPGHTGSYRGPGAMQLQSGGSFVATRPTNLRVGERMPEVVTAQPLRPVSVPAGDVSVSGTMRHQIGGMIGAQMGSMTGQITNAINASVVNTLKEFFR